MNTLFIPLRRNHLLSRLATLTASLSPLCVATLLTGCSQSPLSPSTPVNPVTPAVITTQPVSQTVPFGGTATFTVSATGNVPLGYQWSKNGTAISGAYSATYTTPPVSAADNGAVYAVVVSDTNLFTSSNSATLTVGARSPKAGDLRFQQVASPVDEAIADVQSVNYNLSTAPGGQATATYAGYLGSPLDIGTAAGTCDPTAPTSCVWGYSVTRIPASTTPITTSYITGPSASFASAIAALPASVSVVTSMDLPPAPSSFALAVVSSSQNAGFDPLLEVVPSGAIQATVNADGLKSRVVTAVTFDSSGNANLLSYGWQGDTTTLYDTTTATVAPANVAAAAASLGAQGTSSRPSAATMQTHTFWLAQRSTATPCHVPQLLLPRVARQGPPKLCPTTHSVSFRWAKHRPQTHRATPAIRWSTSNSDGHTNRSVRILFTRRSTIDTDA